MKFFVDTADVAEIRELAATGLSQITPMRVCAPNGTSTNRPGAISIPSGRR